MFKNFIGQSYLINNKTGILTRMIKNKKYHSFILYAPVGCGKTTLANLFLQNIEARFFNINAADITFKELREVLNTIEQYNNYWLLIDEIHRLDKKQQNLLLPYLDKGLLVIGTTNENPLFTISNALNSRMPTFKFKPITDQEYRLGMQNYCKSIEIKPWNEELLNLLSKITKKDIRSSYNIINLISDNYQQNEITTDLLSNIFDVNFKINYSDSFYYDLLSCLQKSIRASDVNASIYYLACLIEADELDGIIRRLGIIAYEDIGLANSNLCAKVINALYYVKEIGLPEARIILSNLVIELAISPKSTSAYHAINDAINYVENQEEIILPQELTNRFYYDREKARYMNNLPINIDEVFYKPQRTSRYEEALNSKYQELLIDHEKRYDE